MFELPLGAPPLGARSLLVKERLNLVPIVRLLAGVKSTLALSDPLCSLLLTKILSSSRYCPEIK